MFRWTDDMVRFMRDAAGFGSYQTELAGWICSQIPQARHVCDAGCGLGFLALQLAQRAAPRRAVILAAGPGMHMVPINTETPKELSGTPSLVLRCLGKQECAWDLAKRYNTTIAAILSANQLESEEELGRDQLLLIPRKRA